MIMHNNREPDFGNLAAILEKKKPKRPTLFEFMIDEEYISRLVGDDYSCADYKRMLQSRIVAYTNAGYDFAMMHSTLFHFKTGERKMDRTVSANEGSLIFDRASLDNYEWNEPEDFTLEHLEAAAEILTHGMKLIICSPCGVLENAVAITGYEKLCELLYEDEEVVSEIFEGVGSRLVRYYDMVLKYDFVGAVMLNDDWGFKTQTMLSPKAMKKYVFPWHKRIVQNAHSKGKYAMLHSCGNYSEIIDDIIYDMRFDGRHSYEDNIIPVEQAYESLKSKIAVLGGIDMSFLIQASVDEVRERCRKMLKQCENDGCYALGSGNSITTDIPFENFSAMLKAVSDV